MWTYTPIAIAKFQDFFFAMHKHNILYLLDGLTSLCTFCVIGIDGYNFDPTGFAMDYRSLGFCECVAKVARYLVTAEGTFRIPLRLCKLSHLQCHAPQRDADQKSILTTGFHHQSNSWNHMPHHSWNPQYNIVTLFQQFLQWFHNTHTQHNPNMRLWPCHHTPQLAWTLCFVLSLVD
jgi:hypothetical protein